MGSKVIEQVAISKNWKHVDSSTYLHYESTENCFLFTIKDKMTISVTNAKIESSN